MGTGRICSLFSLSFFSFQCVIAGGLASISTDQSALLAFKSHISFGPNKVLETNWSVDSTVCSWIGVNCGRRHRRVTALNISGMSLSGRIPPHLGNLSFLHSLDIYNNSFHGNLPEELAKLHRLELLDLSSNCFSGTIPTFFSSLTNLQFLYLSRNEFSGSIPSSISNISKLEELTLYTNSLEGSIPQRIGDLHSLTLLDLENNQLTGPIPSNLFNISSLEIIALTNNSLSGELPGDICHNLPKLHWLYLGVNNLDGPIPPSIQRCSQLDVISLFDNKFMGTIPREMGNLTMLAKLDLGDNNLEGSIPMEMGNLRRLERFAANNAGLSGSIPAAIFNISTLRVFSLEGNRLSGNIPEEIGNHGNISYLGLSENELSGVIPRTFQGLQSLQELYLDNNWIRGSLLSNICNLKNLGAINLSGNQISGALPACIGDITTLRKIFLDSNNFSSSLPSSLWKLKDLLQLTASSNSLSGRLPPEIGNLKVITQIDLSMNSFSGNIPISVAGLQNLRQLSLANNELEGPIPDSLGKVLSLEVLDLSYNWLTGVIPQSLEALSYLKKFNVSFNQLSGEIPRKGPFLNFTGESFMSDGALCGSSQFNVPPCRNIYHNRRKRLLVIFLVLFGISSPIFLAVLGIGLTKRHKRKQPTLVLVPTAGLEHERISYHELKRATNGFSESNLLGKGSYSFVYEGIFSNSTRAAVKVFNLNVAGASESFDRECDLLCNLRHRNLAKVITCCSTPDFKALVLEYMPNGSLEKWLYSHNYFLDILQRLDIMIDVASAIDYLHNGNSMPVVHCDLKPSNVLLDEYMVAHVSDFGIAKLLGAEDNITQTKTLATIGYIAPEYGQEGLVSTKCDIYSFGIMLMEIFTRMRPSDDIFSGDMSVRNWIKCSIPNAIMQVADSNLLKPEEHSFDAKALCLLSLMDLALQCTSELPDSRINIKDVLSRLENIRLQLVTSND